MTAYQLQMKQRRWIFWDSIRWGTYFFGMQPPQAAKAYRDTPERSYIPPRAQPIKQKSKKSLLTRLIKWFLSLIKINHAKTRFI